MAPNDQFVLAVAAGVEMNTAGNYVQASHLAECAIELNPRNAYSLFWGGWIDLEFGRLERGLERLRKVLRFEPVSPHREVAVFGVAQALFFLGRDEQAVETLAAAIHFRPGYMPAHAIHVAALARLGRLEEARAAAAPLLAHGPLLDSLRYFSQKAHRKILREAFARIGEATPQPAPG
jgi:adenylate cyclase